MVDSRSAVLNKQMSWMDVVYFFVRSTDLSFHLASFARSSTASVMTSLQSNSTPRILKDSPMGRVGEEILGEHQEQVCTVLKRGRFKHLGCKCSVVKVNEEKSEWRKKGCEGGGAHKETSVMQKGKEETGNDCKE